jgi:amylosucrase
MAAPETAGQTTDHDAAQFEARLRRWWPDVLTGLRDVYDEATANGVAARLESVARAAHAVRSAELRALDYERLLRPDRLGSEAMVGYAAYADRFAGTLADVTDRLDYLGELGVTYLHLMPLLRPREGDNDGGYAVADHRTIRPDLGTMADLADLTAALRGRGMSLVLDLVLNHVAREHEWAERARAGEDRYRAYFHTFPDRELPDAYEASLPEVFPDFAPGNFTWDDELAAWVWTTFNAFQWDLNWANPDVLIEFAQIVLDLANAGVEVLRLDAIAFLWKRMGTDCQGQPEVHSLTQILRAVARIVAPATAFKAEAIVAPSKLVAYLGQGRWTGKVSELAYHNSLMVQIWSALATKDARLAARSLAKLPALPTGTAWITYLRCHDDIGWAISDEDCAAIGWDGPAHRRFLSDWYSGNFPASRARGLVFQHNPATDDRRISGTAASLIGLENDEYWHDIHAAELDLKALRLAHAIIYGWGGIPVLWSGDELATPNDPDWAAEPGHEDDNRWAGRPRLDPGRVALRHDRTSSEGCAFTDLVRLAEVRRSLPHLHAGVPTAIDELHDNGVLPVRRTHPLGVMLQLYNVTPEWRFHSGARLAALGLDRAVDALTGQGVQPGADGRVWLPPYAAWWLVSPDAVS